MKFFIEEKIRKKQASVRTAKLNISLFKFTEKIKKVLNILFIDYK